MTLLKSAVINVNKAQFTQIISGTPQILSPKFLSMFENIEHEDHKGLHLIYSQFRTLEGIGILALVFEANGFAQFKIAKVGIASLKSSINIIAESISKRLL